MAAETPTIVLVHGAWADATGFDAEIRALQGRGYSAIGFGNPLRDLAGDAAYLTEFLRTRLAPFEIPQQIELTLNSDPGIPSTASRTYFAHTSGIDHAPNCMLRARAASFVVDRCACSAAGCGAGRACSRQQFS